VETEGSQRVLETKEEDVCGGFAMVGDSRVSETADAGKGQLVVSKPKANAEAPAPPPTARISRLENALGMMLLDLDES